MEHNETTAMETTAQQAEECFRQGMNCAESVLYGFMATHDTGLPPEAVCLATGFGGGMGRTKNVCGAITGALMALGAANGRKDPLALPEKAERSAQLKTLYPAYAQLLDEVRAQYGTLLCSELTDPHADFGGKERRKSCLQIVSYCAGLAAKYAAMPTAGAE